MVSRRGFLGGALGLGAAKVVSPITPVTTLTAQRVTKTNSATVLANGTVTIPVTTGILSKIMTGGVQVVNSTPGVLWSIQINGTQVDTATGTGTASNIQLVGNETLEVVGTNLAPGQLYTATFQGIIDSDVNTPFVPPAHDSIVVPSTSSFLGAFSATTVNGVNTTVPLPPGTTKIGCFVGPTVGTADSMSVTGTTTGFQSIKFNPVPATITSLAFNQMNYFEGLVIPGGDASLTVVYNNAGGGTVNIYLFALNTETLGILPTRPVFVAIVPNGPDGNATLARELDQSAAVSVASGSSSVLLAAPPVGYYYELIGAWVSNLATTTAASIQQIKGTTTNQTLAQVAIANGAGPAIYADLTQNWTRPVRVTEGVTAQQNGASGVALNFTIMYTTLPLNASPFYRGWSA